MDNNRRKNDRLCKFIESNALRENIYDSNLNIKDLPPKIISALFELELANDKLNSYMNYYMRCNNESKSSI